MRIFEFRSEVILWSVNNVLWGLAFLVLINMMFAQVTTIAGWGKLDVLLVMATQEMFLGLMWLQVIPSALALTDTIRFGRLDWYLTKPIHSQFMASTMKFEFDNYTRITVMALSMAVILANHHVSVTVFGIVGYILAVAIGMVIFYSIFLMFTTLAFWITTIFNLEDLFDSMLSVGKYPTYVFNGGIRMFFFYILPIVYVSTFPVQILRGNAGLVHIGIGLIIAGAFLFLSNRFWSFALKHYSSASS